MKRKFIIGLVCCLVIIGATFVYAFNNVEEKEELTSSQISRMIELGVIQVHPQLTESENDKNIGLTYQTEYGDCRIYQEIPIGRYYCRW